MEDWRKGDIIDDTFQYGVDTKNGTPKVDGKPIKISKDLEEKIKKVKH